MTMISILIPEILVGDEEGTIDYIARRITIGARRAMLQLTSEWQESKAGRFSHSGAEFLHWHYQDIGLAEKMTQRRKPTVAREFSYYRLTTKGLKVKRSLERQGIT